MLIFLLIFTSGLDQPPQIQIPDSVTDSKPVIERAYQSLDERLTSRMDDLKHETDETLAQAIATDIRSIWRQQGGATADLLLLRANAAMNRGDLITAGRAYSHLRNLEPGFAEAWVASAEHAVQGSDWAFALEALNTAVNLDPRRYDAWTMLGSALERANANTAALEAYREALKLYPLHPQAKPAHARLEAELAGRAL